MNDLYLVDDDPIIIERLKNDILEINSSINIKAFTCALTCLDELKKLDCTRVTVVSDMHMEPVDGVSFVRKIREEGLEVDKIFILSSSKSYDQISKIASLKVSGYLLKPWSQEKLLRIIE